MRYTGFMLHRPLVIGRDRLLGVQKKRTWEIDFLRGICILAVVFDHFMLDFFEIVPSAANWLDNRNGFFVAMSGFARWYWRHPIRVDLVRLLVVFTFLMLSGISCTFSRSNQKRFFKLAAAASAVTVATYFIAAVAMPDLIIAFGILHIMAANVLIFMGLSAVLRLILPKTRRFDTAVYLVLGAIMMFLGLLLPAAADPEFVGSLRYFGTGELSLAVLWPWILISAVLLLLPAVHIARRKIAKKRLPKAERTAKIWVTAAICAVFCAFAAVILLLLPALSEEAAIAAVGPKALGGFGKILLGTGAFGSDYYGILPYTGVFLIGAATGRVFYADKKSLLPRWDKGLRVGKTEKYPFHAAFGFCGRNAIWVYLIHQVAGAAIILLAAIACGYKWW